MRVTAAVLAALVAVTAAGPPARRVGAAGVTVRLPAGWHGWVPPADITPVTDPLTRLVAASAPFHFAARGCQVSAYAFPSTAVAIVVVEWVTLGRNDRRQARPARFTAKNLVLHRPPAIECFAGPGGSIEFAQHGRRFGAYLLAGRRARPSVVVRARSVLDTLTVAPR